MINLVNAEFLRKVSKDRSKALTCQYLTDIDDDNIKELLNKAMWEAIKGNHCSSFSCTIRKKELEKIRETLTELGFIVSNIGFLNNIKDVFDNPDNIETYQNIIISWHDGD